MRKLLYTLIGFAFIFTSCDKQRNPVDKEISGCAMQMKELFNDEIKCSQEPYMEVNIYMGTYKNENVYFLNTICPTCNTLPPIYGYNCKKEKIFFSSFDEVEYIKQIYNGCTKQFIE